MFKEFYRWLKNLPLIYKVYKRFYMIDFSVATDAFATEEENCTVTEDDEVDKNAKLKKIEIKK